MDNEQKRLSRVDVITTTIFILVQAVLFVLVFTTNGTLHKIACFGCVINPFAYSFKFLSKDKISIYTQIGLLGTVFADLFLVVINPQIKEVAMIFFSITQICYFLRLLSLTKHKKTHIILCVVYVVAIIAITIIVLKSKTDFLSIISMFYYANIILNVVYAFAFFKESPLFAIGMLLFLLCDTLIGLDVAGGAYISISETSAISRLLSLPFNLAWVFYVPSQALIALSLNKRSIKINKV